MPHWFASLPDWPSLPVLALLVAASGFFLNAYQAYRNTKLQRANFVSDGFKLFLTDEQMHKAFYAIEYAEFTYTDAFHGSELEPKIDRLLRHFSNIARLVEMGLIRLEDIRPFGYYFVRVRRSKEVAKYYDFLSDYCREASLGEHPFESFMRVADRLEALNARVNKVTLAAGAANSRREPAVAALTSTEVAPAKRPEEPVSATTKATVAESPPKPPEFDSPASGRPARRDTD